MIYGFSSRDVARLRNLLAAYERGRVRIDAPSQDVPDDHQCDSTLGNVGSSIPAGQVGSAYIVDLDTSTPTPGQTTETLVPSIPVFNPGSSALAAGTYLLTREPSQGYYVPSAVGSGGTLSYLTGGNSSSHSLTTSWGNVGVSVNLPANSTWHVSATINGSITSSSTATGDSLSFRLNDGTTTWGSPIECCNAICSSITFVDDCALFAVVTVGGSPVTLNVQGIVNTSTGSTGSMLSSNYLTAIRLQ